MEALQALWVRHTVGQLALRGEYGLEERHRELIGDAIGRTPKGVNKQQLILLKDSAAAVGLQYLVGLFERTGAITRATAACRR